MTAKEYILSQLNALKAPFALDVKPTNNSEMVDAIFKFLFSKKFRKFSVPENNQAIIRAAIEKNIVNEEPIKISWPFGGYKLWSLEETPEVDWGRVIFYNIFCAVAQANMCFISKRSNFYILVRRSSYK
jgi:hypothetical protein